MILVCLSEHPIIILTNDDDSVVFAADGDVGLAFRTQTSNVGTLGTHDARECRTVGKSQETNMRHFFSVLEGVASEL